MKSLITRRINSIKTKLIIVPVTLLIVAILVLGLASIISTRNSLLEEMKLSGFDLADQVVGRISNNNQALTTIISGLDDKILGAARHIIANEEVLSDEFLTQLAKNLNLNAIHWYNSQGMIIQSAYGEYLGWTPDNNHPVYQFMNSPAQYLVEDIRQDSESNNFYKYGYFKSTSGSFVQIGLLANDVNQLTESFNYQALVDELTEGDNILYASFIDQNFVAEAHSERNRIGMTFSDPDTKNAMEHGVYHAYRYYYEPIDGYVLDVTAPVKLEGITIGVLRIGLSMDEVNAFINRSIISTIIIGLLALITLGTTLVFISLRIAKFLEQIKLHMNLIASGDLTQQLPANLLNQQDELGEIARAVEVAQTSIKGILGDVTKAALATAVSSQELSAATEETSASVEEVASATNEFAATVQGIADNAQDMVTSAHSIRDIATKGAGGVEQAVSGTVALTKTMGEIEEIVSGLGQRSNEIGRIIEVINGISEQTNLLALNATIEAARAGEHGRGFAVVADEVRKLAEQSGSATLEITALINAIQEETGRTISGIASSTKQAEVSSQLVNENGQLLQNILIEINGIMGKIEEVSRGTETISSGSQELAATTEQQSASVETIAIYAQDLSNMSENLESLVKQFKLDHSDGHINQVQS